MQYVGNISCTSCGTSDVYVQRDYGMTLHPHWNGYRDVIDSASDWLFYGIGTYITLVSVVSVLASSTVIFATIRWAITLLGWTFVCKLAERLFSCSVDE